MVVELCLSHALDIIFVRAHYRDGISNNKLAIKNNYFLLYNQKLIIVNLCFESLRTHSLI